MSKAENTFKDFYNMIQVIAWAFRTTVPSTIPYSPGQLNFGRDMIFRVKAIVDWNAIQWKHTLAAHRNNMEQNRGQKVHMYNIGDKELIIHTAYDCDKKGKLTVLTRGTFKILEVYNNGTMLINQGYREHIHIRRLRPYNTNTSL